MKLLIKSTNKTLFCVIGIVTFVLIFALNYFFPLYADDMLYSVFKHKESFDFTTAVNETVQFLDLYFFTWGGRLIAHLFAFILLFFDNIPLSIIKSSCYLTLVYFSYKLVKSRNDNDCYLFLFFSLSFFYFTPSFLSSAVWTTGSANYLFMITLTVIYMYCVKTYLIDRTKQLNVIQILLFSILSICVGCTNENLAPVLILLLLSIVVWLKYQKRHVNTYIYISIALVMIGCVILVFAPGNAIRAEKEGYQSLFNSLDTIQVRLSGINASYKYFMLRPLIIYFISLILFCLFPKINVSIGNTILSSFLFLLIANISIWITLFSPSFPPRAFMSITGLTFIAIGILYARIDFSKILPMIINGLFLLVLLVFAGKDYLTFLKGSYFLDQVMKQRIEVIDQAKAQGENEIYLEKVFLDYRFEYSDFGNYYQDYYGLKVNFVDYGDSHLQTK